ncbi:MAG: tRNA1(Val) (adenine(37)-N6)-methyltransferase [Bavariicoccus seileri]|uniref:tRNA1(Val) (adenine(37)-N6)-methyltransferase n=1 Tax=Bavariicoccus seileri TaxID=549685 RepID=UPI003F9D1647
MAMPSVEKITQYLKDGERVDQLRQEGIGIIQHPEVFAFSMDAVLLAYFAKPPRQQRAKLVDLCAGNGAVAFLLRHKVIAPITLVEIQDRLADMAKRTIALNGVEDRYQVINCDALDVLEFIKVDSVDYLTCNPPYFTSVQQQKTHHLKSHQLARHESTATFDDFARVISRLLKTRGKAAIVHRPERLTELLSTLGKYQLEPKRLQLIYPKVGKEANGVLIEVMHLGSANGLHVLPPIIVHEIDDSYTPLMKELLGVSS